MYQNGARIKGYLKTRQHKRKLKDKQYRSAWRDDYLSYRNWPYWKQLYISGVKKYANDYTEEALRSEFRNVKHIILYAIDEDELDDVVYYDGADYRKCFDYEWTIW